MLEREGTTNALDCIAIDIISEVLEKEDKDSFVGETIEILRKEIYIIEHKESSHGKMAKIKRDSEKYAKLKNGFDQEISKNSINLEWREKLSVLFAVLYGDYSYLNQYGVSFGRGYFYSYCYQPVEKGRLPLDADKWERVILNCLMKKIDKNWEQLCAVGSVNGGNVTDMSALLWLARYGRSDSTKNYLLEMPFVRYGWLSLVQKNEPFKLSGDIKDVFVFEKGDNKSWGEWYVEEIIKPAGIFEEYKHRLSEQEDAIKKIIKIID
ncbi:MAG: hypothetical protein PF495_15280 [Spirochaetales bacterium]|nr:hypothetical protein [Spirochaetales bacterium]